MIKLAPMVRRVLKEAKRGSGTYEYSFELDDDIHIPALVLPSESMEITVLINYNYYIGRAGRSLEDPPESDDVDISDWDVDEITITTGNGERRHVNLRFLHPLAKKALYVLIEKQLKKNNSDIESSIMNGIPD